MSDGLFISDLKLNIKGDVLSDRTSLGLYATDASVYQIEPIVIVLPKDTDDVQEAIRIAADHDITILPRGGGTSLAGQTVGHSMILDFSKYMNQLLELNVSEKWVRVQPGLVRDELNAVLKEHKLHFAPDPATSSRANVGGMIGNNSSGTKSILYGKTVDHVLELEVTLADGTNLHIEKLSKDEYNAKSENPGREGEIYRGFSKIIKDNAVEIEARFPKVMRRVQGYNLDEFIHTEDWNLSKVICGSEGTLAAITEVKLNLEPLPKFKSICVVHFSDLRQSIEAVNQMLPFEPSAIEILDKTVIQMSRENLTTRRHSHFIEGNPVSIQIVEFYGDTYEDVMDRPTRMIEHLKTFDMGYAYPLFPEGEYYDDVWVIRKKGLGLMLGVKGKKKPLPFIEDSGIPTDVLPEYIERVLNICKENNTEAAMYAHASVGVIHVRPILDLRDAEDIKRFKNISEATFQLVQEYGGSWSGEHGDGLVRSFYLKRYFGDQVYDALKQVKNLFDPKDRMNPGKIIDAQPIDENLRYGTQYQDEPLSTVYKYRDDESFGNAVHMCTGVGECRKMLGGTMCPSFKATREEEHSTRGRANALRLAMSGQLDHKGLLDDRLKDALDLCLSCKACKSECPSNVDMAKLKSEVLQMRYDANGASLRDKAIRDSSKMAGKLSGKAAGFVNGIMGTSLVKSVIEKTAGFDKRRSLPTYTKEPFYKWFESNYLPPTGDTSKVILFADTYMNYHEPQIGIAATKMLSAFGFEVILANIGCCQRPKISHGFLKSAKKDGTILAQSLDQLMTEDISVVVCEPSCASALNDDLPDLINDEHLALKLKEKVLSLDVFIENQITAFKKSNKALPKLKSTSKQMLLHGHCHQKALYGTGSLKTIFENIEDVNLKEIPSGCCGMAGSFGYEKEHYEISKKIGELSLFPPIRESSPDTIVIANGFSCRHQIADFTERKAVHWVEAIEVVE